MGKNICANFPHFLLDKLAVVWYNGISGRCDWGRPAQKSIGKNAQKWGENSPHFHS